MTSIDRRFRPYPFSSLASRLRHAAQVTCSAGGSAQTEPAPGSSAHSAMRQYGVTAWKIASRPGRTRPDLRRETNTRPARTNVLPGRMAGVIVQQQSSGRHPSGLASVMPNNACGSNPCRVRIGRERRARTGQESAVAAAKIPPANLCRLNQADPRRTVVVPELTPFSTNRYAVLNNCLI